MFNKENTSNYLVRHGFFKDEVFGDVEVFYIIDKNKEVKNEKRN